MAKDRSALIEWVELDDHRKEHGVGDLKTACQGVIIERNNRKEARLECMGVVGLDDDPKFKDLEAAADKAFERATAAVRKVERALARCTTHYRVAAEAKRRAVTEGTRK